MLTFREDPLLRCGHEDLGYGVEGKQQQRFKSSESVTEIHEGRDEDQDIENNGSDIAQRHSGWQKGVPGGCANRLGRVLFCELIIFDRLLALSLQSQAS